MIIFSGSRDPNRVPKTPLKKPFLQYMLYRAMVLNLFTEGSQIQTYDFVRDPH